MIKFLPVPINQIIDALEREPLDSYDRDYCILAAEWLKKMNNNRTFMCNIDIEPIADVVSNIFV